MEADILIFVLDDNKNMLDIIKEYLDTEGLTNYKCFTSPNELMENVTVDVRICIIDYLLNSRMNGIDVIKRIQSLNPTCYFILITGFKTYEVVEQFCNTVVRGRFVAKGEIDTHEKLVKFIWEFIQDIRMMEQYYLHKEELIKSITELKKIINK